MAELAELFTLYATSPLWVLLSLFAMTFILEDAAVASGAYLISQDIASPVPVITILFAGILIGDGVLYLIGRAAHHHRWAARLTRKNSVSKLHQMFQQHVFVSVLVSRFIPGLRLPVYLAAGFFNASPVAFFTSALVAVLLWGGLAVSVFSIAEPSQLYVVMAGFVILPIMVRHWQKRRRAASA